MMNRAEFQDTLTSLHHVVPGTNTIVIADAFLCPRCFAVRLCYSFQGLTYETTVNIGTLEDCPHGRICKTDNIIGAERCDLQENPPAQRQPTPGDVVNNLRCK